VVSGAALRNVALNWSPCVRSLIDEPLAWTNSPAVIAAAAPTTVTSPVAPDLDPQHTEAGLRVVVSHPLDRAG